MMCCRCAFPVTHKTTSLYFTLVLPKGSGIFLTLLLTRTMDYLFNRNFLIFLTVGAIINSRGQGTLIEPKVPKMVKACIGSNTTIRCMVQTDGLKVDWFFVNTSEFNEDNKIQFHSPHDSNDIPRLIIKYSNGSKLVISLPAECNVEEDTTNSTTVYDSPTDSNLEDSTKNSTTTDASETPNVSPCWLWVAVAVGCVLIITAVITTTVICRRKKEAPIYENTNEALKRHWKEDKALRHGIPSKGYSHKQMDTLKPHKHEYVHNVRKLSPKL
ncbi:hypothetical protein AMELA_G00142500 [Ameiurus melas]|uniref:Uncharacterized protein n=1 Tax=Ameiurus melas TaxID=219545 RepID=A0A7J6AKN2_AMEME|nr:hypothetical protein AMELA_G00142500 [Ameiurus melas]